MKDLEIILKNIKNNQINKSPEIQGF